MKDEKKGGRKKTAKYTPSKVNICKERCMEDSFLYRQIK